MVVRERHDPWTLLLGGSLTHPAFYNKQARTPESGDMLLRSFPQREYQHRPCEQRNAVKMGVPYCSRKLASSYVASKRTKSRQFSCPILP